MAGEPGSRFAHLLQPIRDLSKVWKIEIADELERYIEEVSHIIVTNPEDGITQLNFAEAALLIQGSTAIYSRKVELLYQLVYQALDLLALDKGKDGAQGRKGKCVQTGLWAPIPETEELLTIDHLIKEGRNILIENHSGDHRQALQRRVPLFLMPRDQADRRKKEFRISSCTVHRSGAYLLQESDAKLLDDLVGAGDSLHGGECDAPLVPAPPREVQDLDERLQELLRELPKDKSQSMNMDQQGEDEAEGQLAKQTPKEAVQTPATGRSKVLGATPVQLNTPEKVALPAAPDPWTLLDEHESTGHDLPLEVGKTSKRVNAKKLLLNAEEGSATVGGRSEAQRAGFGAAWLEFEDLFAAAAGKRRQLKASAKSHPNRRLTEEDAEDQASDAEVSDDEDKKGVCVATPQRVSTPLRKDDPLTPGTCPKAPAEQHNEKEKKEEAQRREVEMLETMIQDAQQKYESTVRLHLQKMQKDALDVDHRKFPQLYANVRKWQDQLKPVLKEFDSRPEFDIHEYSTSLLSKMSALQDTDEEQVVPFSRLVQGQPRWEVCRRFLSCLFLTNQGNTDILFSGEEERLNHFRIKLLSAEKKMISLEEEEGTDQTKQARAGRGKKSLKKAGSEPKDILQDAKRGADELATTGQQPKKVARRSNRS